MRTLLLLAILAWAAPVWAAGSVPINITADSMQYTQKGDQVVFTGNVLVVRQDLKIWAETLTVLLERKQGTKKDDKTAADKTPMDDKGSIKRILAVGNVRLEADKGRSGTCGRATYEAASDLLTLEDNPILRDGPNTVQGDIIKLHIKENRSEVIGGKKRVQATFVTPEGSAIGLPQ